MRLALIVGINYYDHVSRLYGCANDANTVKSVLERHGDGAINFDCRLLSATDLKTRVDRSELKDHVAWLFKQDAEIALFYFAGHGHIETTGGYLLTTDASRGDEGVSLSDIVTMANQSSATNKVILLDSCHSGIAGAQPTYRDTSTLVEGLTILTASTSDQYATEENGRGVFTTLLVDALNGSAANLTGDVTPGSVYAHIDQSLGGWEQRPVFKANVKQFVSLRRASPAIPIKELRRIGELFPQNRTEYELDPTFEPEQAGRPEGAPGPIEHNTEIFSILQTYNRVGLLVPVAAPHMWQAAMQSKSCRLTELGEHYRRLALRGRI